MFSSSVSERTVLVLILAVVAAIQLFFIHSVASVNETNAYLYHKCLEKDGKYKSKSLYEKNLNSLISNTSVEDYIYGVYGYSPDTVYMVIQCRGDSYGPKCDTCLSTAYSEVNITFINLFVWICVYFSIKMSTLNRNV